MQQISSNQPRAVSGAQCPMEQQGHVPTGQQGYAPTGQTVQSVPGPGVPIQPLVNQPRVGRIDKTYLKTALGIMRDLEFVSS